MGFFIGKIVLAIAIIFFIYSCLEMYSKNKTYKESENDNKNTKNEHWDVF